jgi:2-iminobutanoate/2-iminopropanoate deaminase
MSDQVQLVTSSTLPTPAGPYSPATIAGNLVFVSGQGGRDPSTNQLAGPDVETQTEQVLKNIGAILEAAGSGLSHVLRCGVFLVDITEFPRMNEVYGRMFGSHRPARTTVEVSNLPGVGMRVEIDAIALIPGSRPRSR